MSSVRSVSALLGALAFSACNRPSEPPPGPGSVNLSTSAQTRASGASLTLNSAGVHRNSVHDRDMPESAPSRPPADNAQLIRASHILIAYKGALDAPDSVQRDQQAAKKLASFVAMEARAGGNFGALAAKYSDDAKTKADSGQLGQISRTQMSKVFTDAAFGLMVKEITMDPVETAVGFHIIKRTE
jgi:parvulin-like peptidyl-prolyl cis-trans isomerase-like protein